jgi:hypothetical protein
MGTHDWSNWLYPRNTRAPNCEAKAASGTNSELTHTRRHPLLYSPAARAATLVAHSARITLSASNTSSWHETQHHFRLTNSCTIRTTLTTAVRNTHHRLNLLSLLNAVSPTTRSFTPSHSTHSAKTAATTTTIATAPGRRKPLQTYSNFATPQQQHHHSNPPHHITMRCSTSISCLLAFTASYALASEEVSNTTLSEPSPIRDVS